MALQHERPIYLDIATSSKERTMAFASLLPPDRVRQVPFGFTETTIHKPVNSSPAEWPFEVAKEKALQDVAGLLVLGTVNNVAHKDLVGEIMTRPGRTIRLYSDTVQVSYDADSSDDTPRVLEKPANLEQWLKDPDNGALQQSGKNFEICTALTGIDLTNPLAHPATVLVRIAGKMRPFTIDDVLNVINTHGPYDVTMAAGGISIQNGGTDLYDKTQPLRCYVQTDPNVAPRLAFEIPTWDHLDLKTLRRFVYGAVPEALQALVTQIDISQHVSELSKKKGLIFPYPSENDEKWQQNKPS